MIAEWLFYRCVRDDAFAIIFYDHGIRESIEQVAPPTVLRVRVVFKEQAYNGMPPTAEFEDLFALHQSIESLVKRHGSVYVGNITTKGYRQFHIFTPDGEDAWAPRLNALARRYGYEASIVIEPDEKHEAYWRDLFPTDDDWQTILDLRVIEALRKESDDGSVPRIVDHWAYFPSDAACEMFCDWLRERGYRLAPNRPVKDRTFGVAFSHKGTVQLEEIGRHTIPLRRRAAELGGEYDGWETEVISASAKRAKGSNSS